MNRTFTKFFISYIAIIFVSISLLSSVLYVQFSRSSLAEIQLSLQEMLNQTAGHMGFTREYVYSLGLQIVHDSEVMNIIYGDKISTIDKYLISLEMANIINANPIIHSIYLYNSNHNEIQHNLSISNSSFRDPEILSFLTNVNVKQNLQFIPRNVVYTSSSGEEVQEYMITLIFTDMIGQSNNTYNDSANKKNLDGALVINLKAEYVSKSMNTALRGKDSYTAIVDGMGNVISDSDLHNFGKNIANEPLLKDIMTSSGQWGYEVKKTDGKRTVVTYMRSTTYPWTFINVSSYDSLFQKFHQLMITLSVICLIIFIIGIILSLLAARNVYLPFSRLVKNINSQLFSRKLNEGGKDHSDDARYLSNAFSHILEHSDHLELTVKDSNSIIKRDQLKRILSGSMLLDQELCSSFGDSAVGVMLFSMDGYSKFSENYDKQTQNYIKSSIDAIVMFMLPEYFAIEPVYFEEDKYCVLVGIKENLNYLNQAEKAAFEIQNNIQQQLGVTVSVAIGQSVNSLDDAYLSYSNSMELLNYRFVQGYNSILTHVNLEQKHKKEFASIDKNKKRLTDALKLSNLIQVENELDEIIREISGYQYNYIMLIFNQLVLDVLKTVEAHIDSNAEELDFNSVYRELNTMDALADLKSWFMVFCEKINRMTENKRTNRKTDMIQGIMEYITNNYANGDIGIEMLADKAGLSPGYFGKLFSESVGKTVTEYIIELKMQKSKTLLENSLQPINDIAFVVGFSNPAYFTTIFKKHYGITPNQYRSEYRKRLQ